MSDGVEWRWVDVDGEQHVVDFTELADALATGALPSFVLVWRTGWKEWLAAENSPELSYALGMDRSGPPSFQRANPDLSAPPAPPLERYPASAAMTLRNPLVAGRSSTVPPARPDRKPLRPPVPGIPPPPAFVSSAPVPIRDVMPTLADDGPVRSPTLRPAGALPPPPRAIPQAKLPVFEDVLDPSEAAPPVAPARPVMPAPPTSPAPRPAAASRPSIPQLDTRRAPRERDAPGRAPVAPATTAPGARARSAPRRGAMAATATGGLSRQTIATLTSAGLVLPGALLLTLALMRPSKKHADGSSASPSAVAVAASAAPPAPAPAGCLQNGPAKRLSAPAYVGVPVLLSTTDRGRVAVGFATAKDHALGITVDPTNLVVEPAFEQPVTDAAPLGVVPLVRGGALTFAVDRADPALAFARTVDAPKRFTIGVGSEGLSRKSGDVIDVIWPGKAKNPTITTPRVASVPGTGHVVAFRHGGQDGKVLVGWLTDDGSKLTNLKAVASESTLVGTPTVSASDRSVLVAFAGKVAADQGFRVELAVAAHGALPEHAKVFDLPPGGPSGEAISPSSEGLSDGRFLLQWTEGSAGNRAVRAQLLSRDLVPTGDAITVSTPEQNAGQGALWVHGDAAVALYLVKTETSHELWGASLKCH